MVKVLLLAIVFAISITANGQETINYFWGTCKISVTFDSEGIPFFKGQELNYVGETQMGIAQWELPDTYKRYNGILFRTVFYIPSDKKTLGFTVQNYCTLPYVEGGWWADGTTIWYVSADDEGIRRAYQQARSAIEQNSSNNSSGGYSGSGYSNGGYSNGGYSGSNSSTSTYSTCRICGGTGVCTSCHGTGGSWQDTGYYTGSGNKSWISCGSCNGSKRCFNCYGTGRQ